MPLWRLKIDLHKEIRANLREVASLDHEVRDDAVERAALVVQRFATFAGSLFAGAQRTEVLRSLWHDVAVQLKVRGYLKKLKNEPTSNVMRPADCPPEKNWYNQGTLCLPMVTSKKTWNC